MIVPFRAWHLLCIDVQNEQAFMKSLFDNDYAESLEGYEARTAMIGGVPVACAGIVDVAGRKWAWAVLGAGAMPVMLAATRACLAVLSGHREVFAHVRQGFGAGIRWLDMLGFKPCSGEPERGPDGRRYDIWVRTNG